VEPRDGEGQEHTQIEEESFVKSTVTDIQSVMQEDVNLFCNTVVILQANDPGKVPEPVDCKWYYYDTYRILRNDAQMWLTWNSLYEVIKHELSWWEEVRESKGSENFISGKQYRECVYRLTKKTWELKKSLDSASIDKQWTDFTGSDDSFGVARFASESFDILRAIIVCSPNERRYDFDKDKAYGERLRKIRESNGVASLHTQ